MGLGAAHHPCLLHCPPGTWVGAIPGVRGLEAGGGLGTSQGASYSQGSRCSPLACLPEQGYVCRGEGPLWTSSVLSNRVHFYFPSSLPLPPSTLSIRMPLSLCLPTHATYPPLGHGPPLPSRPPPPWHRMARWLAHGGPRITPARWVPRSSKPASSAWVMILATTPRYLPTAWSTLGVASGARNNAFLLFLFSLCLDLPVFSFLWAVGLVFSCCPCLAHVGLLLPLLRPLTSALGCLSWEPARCPTSLLAALHPVDGFLPLPALSSSFLWTFCLDVYLHPPMFLSPS